MRRSRPVAWLLVLALVGPAFAGILHAADGHGHRWCPTHTAFEEVQGQAAREAAPASLDAAATNERHEICAFSVAAPAAESWTDAPAVTTPVAPLAPHAPAIAAPAPPLSPLTVAPKASPPAFAS